MLAISRPLAPVTDSILVGVAVLLCSVFILATVSALTVRTSAALARRDFASGFLHDVVILMVVVLIGLTGIVVQLSIWAMVLWTLDQFPGFRDAFYCSANNFTALGLDRLEIDGKWRLLGPLEAINGAFMFGMTTAMLFTIMTRLAALRATRMIKEEREKEATGRAKSSAEGSGRSPPTIGSPSWFL